MPVVGYAYETRTASANRCGHPPSPVALHVWYIGLPVCLCLRVCCFCCLGVRGQCYQITLETYMADTLGKYGTGKAHVLWSRQPC